jgi:voltage-gated potassium channel Kch
MLFRLSMAAGLVATTVVIQALFMSAGLRTFKRMEEQRPGRMARRAAITTVIWVLFLLIPITLDVTLWATFYYVSGALPSLDEALYFSAVTFTTVGYGDIILSHEWRQLATFEAINGWIIFGWATALIMAVIQRLYFTFDAGRRSGQQ